MLKRLAQSRIRIRKEELNSVAIDRALISPREKGKLHSFPNAGKLSLKDDASRASGEC